jgi:hypothetical protein
MNQQLVYQNMNCYKGETYLLLRIYPEKKLPALKLRLTPTEIQHMHNVIVDAKARH